MSMPKGYKKKNGYATTAELGGSGYVEIADKMNDMGFKMNHSTARNVFHIFHVDMKLLFTEDW